MERNEIRGSESDFIFCHFAVADKSYDSTERLKGTAENRIQSKIVKIRMF